MCFIDRKIMGGPQIFTNPPNLCSWPEIGELESPVEICLSSCSWAVTETKVVTFCTAYKNSATPYPVLALLTPYETFLFLRIMCLQQCHSALIMLQNCPVKMMERSLYSTHHIFVRNSFNRYLHYFVDV